LTRQDQQAGKRWLVQLSERAKRCSTVQIDPTLSHQKRALQRWLQGQSLEGVCAVDLPAM
jgi:hypothetical protein